MRYLRVLLTSVALLAAATVAAVAPAAPAAAANCYSYTHGNGAVARCPDGSSYNYVRVRIVCVGWNTTVHYGPWASVWGGSSYAPCPSGKSISSHSLILSNL